MYGAYVPMATDYVIFHEQHQQLFSIVIIARPVMIRLHGITYFNRPGKERQGRLEVEEQEREPHDGDGGGLVAEHKEDVVDMLEHHGDAQAQAAVDDDDGIRVSGRMV